MFSCLCAYLTFFYGDNVFIIDMDFMLKWHLLRINSEQENGHMQKQQTTT